jgi:vacuolar-type H+-ATPase subunit H
MSKDKDESQSSVTVQDAMSQVLGAEESAREAIQTCEKEALKILQNAKHKAEHVSKHADQRISHIHLRFKQCIALQVKDLQREYADKKQHIHTHHYDAAEIDEIVDNVAAILTGTEQSDMG